MTRIRSLLTVGLAVGATVLAGLLPATNAHAGRVDTVTLPGAAVFPEGVAWADGRFFVGSTRDGTIYTGDLRSGTADILVPASGRTAIGMKVDDAGRLWVAGGNTGRVWVYDTADGSLLAALDARPLVADPTRIFLNDVVVTGDAVFVTDSFNPQIYRVPLDDGSIGPLEVFASYAAADIGFVPGAFNLNGIVARGEWLLVVNSTARRLFRVAMDDGSVEQVTVEGDLGRGDGMVLKGSTLYVVRGLPADAVARVKLSSDLLEATVVDTFGDGLASPTTAARVGGRLIVVESQFGGPGVAPFQVSVVKIGG